MEIWKDIKGYEGLYQVSNLGRVKSLPRLKRNFDINTKQFIIISIPEKIRKLQLTKYGYYRVGLTKDHKQTYHSVHRLVAEAFILNPDNLTQINHKDEVKTNNEVDNLEWCDAKYNANYGARSKRTGKKVNEIYYVCRDKNRI